MAEITLKGNPIHTCGELPANGSAAPSFSLIGGDLNPFGLDDLAGKVAVLNIFPSIDTPTCAESVRRFHQAATDTGATVVNVSMDLPFAQKRFCGAEGIENVINLSAFRSPEFGQDYGVAITDGPLQGLLARAVIVIDGAGEVIYTELVPEIAQEPNYDAALAAVNALA